MKLLPILLIILFSSWEAFSQTITTLSPTQTSFCAGGNIIVQYETTGTFDMLCTYTAQLSDKWGDFSNPVPIGNVPINTGVIFGTIPSNTDFGFYYKVRVISSSPYIIGSESPFPPIVITSSAVTATINTNPGNEICQGDTVELSVLPNESYFWSTGDTTQFINVTQSGTYSVTVTNFITGCEVSAPPVDIVVHPLPPVNLGADQQKCQGDSVILDAGAGYDQYNWNNGTSHNQIFTIFQTGTYFVRVRDTFGCFNSDTTHILFHLNPQISIGNDTSMCSNQFTLSVPPVYEHYNWNNGLSFNPSLDINQSGTYYIIVTNEYNCSGYDTINVTLYPSPFIELGNNIFVCQPPVILNAGDNFTTYNWNNGDSESQYYYVYNTGMQHVTISDVNGCTASDSLYVSIFGIPQLDIGQLITIEYNDTLEIDAGPGMIHYNWSTGDTTQTIIVYAEVHSPGIYFYSVTVTGDYGCSNSDEVTVLILEPASVEESKYSDIIVFPNPFSETLYLKSNNYLNAEIIDISGKTHAEFNINPGINALLVNDIPQGFYLLRISDENKNVVTHKLTKILR